MQRAGGLAIRPWCPVSAVWRITWQMGKRWNTSRTVPATPWNTSGTAIWRVSVSLPKKVFLSSATCLLVRLMPKTKNYHQNNSTRNAARKVSMKLNQDRHGVFWILPHLTQPILQGMPQTNEPQNQKALLVIKWQAVAPNTVIEASGCYFLHISAIILKPVSGQNLLPNKKKAT